MRSVSSGKLLFACGCLQLLGWLVLTWLSHGKLGPGFSYETPNDDTPTWAFFVIQLLMGAIVLATFLIIRKRQCSRPAKIVIGFAIVLRLIALLGEPIHESDFYRYLWDGKTAKAGINPYRFEPGALFLREKEIDFQFEDETTGVTWRGRQFTQSENELLDQLQALRDDNRLLFDRVSHPAVTTIYPPAAQWIFLLSQYCFGDSIIGLKVIITFFDIGIIALTLSILVQIKRSAVWAILYAWNPLPIKEFSNSAHYDSVAIFFMLLAIWISLKQWPTLKKICLACIALALGTLTKYFAILLLPIVLVYLYDEHRDTKDFKNRIISYLTAVSLWTGLALFSAILIISFLPYSIWNQAGWREVFRGLSTYQEHWQYSPGLFSLIHLATNWVADDSFLLAKKLAGLFLCASIAVVGLNKSLALPTKCFWALSALFVLSPTAFPWYFCWALGFAPFQNRLSWVLLSLLLPLNYIDFHSAGSTALANQQWAGFYATQLLSWGLFLITWIGESRNRHFV